MNYEEEWDDDESLTKEENNPDYAPDEEFVESPDEDRASDRSFEEVVKGGQVYKGSVESPVIYTRASNSSFKGKERLTSRELKEKISFTRLLQSEGRVVKTSGKYTKCLCPIHRENTPSFSVFEDDTTAKCWGCNWYGDVYDYIMETRGMDFSGAFTYLEKKLSKIKRGVPFKPSVRKGGRGGSSLLTAEQMAEQKKASIRLATHEGVYRRIARDRGWNPETIRKLAEQGSLGWCGDALAFNYDTGMKIRRWPHKTIRYEFGSPCVWRRNRIGKVEKVYLCEGETDAITLIDKGVEDDGDVVVVALASATTITGDLVNCVKGKAVTLFMDNDAAGEMATDNLIAILEPVCASLNIYSFEEVNHE